MFRIPNQPLFSREIDHEPPVVVVFASVPLTELNVPLILLLRPCVTATSPTTIRPTKTAYSTAVGPSSLEINLRS
jgi:hypothetical protein